MTDLELIESKWNPRECDSTECQYPQIRTSADTRSYADVWIALLGALVMVTGVAAWIWL